MKEKIFKRERTFRYRNHLVKRERFYNEAGIEYVWAVFLDNKTIQKINIIVYSNYKYCIDKKGLIRVAENMALNELIDIKMELYKG